MPTSQFAAGLPTGVRIPGFGHAADWDPHRGDPRPQGGHPCLHDLPNRLLDHLSEQVEADLDRTFRSPPPSPDPPIRAGGAPVWARQAAPRWVPAPSGPPPTRCAPGHGQPGRASARPACLCPRPDRPSRTPPRSRARWIHGLRHGVRRSSNMERSVTGLLTCVVFVMAGVQAAASVAAKLLERLTTPTGNFVTLYAFQTRLVESAEVPICTRRAPRKGRRRSRRSSASSSATDRPSGSPAISSESPR